MNKNTHDGFKNLIYKKIDYTCFGACCGGIRKLEKRVKKL